MTSQVVLASTALLPHSVAPDAADDPWARWIEKGRRHDRARRVRWLEGLALVGVVLLLGTAIIVGLR